MHPAAGAPLLEATRTTCLPSSRTNKNPETTRARETARPRIQSPAISDKGSIAALGSACLRIQPGWESGKEFGVPSVLYLGQNRDQDLTSATRRPFQRALLESNRREDQEP